MLLNLKAEMARKQIRIEDIAKTTKKSSSTVCEIINGKGDFKLREAIMIQESFFPKLEIKELFKRFESSA